MQTKDVFLQVLVRVWGNVSSSRVSGSFSSVAQCPGPSIPDQRYVSLLIIALLRCLRADDGSDRSAANTAKML